MIFSIPQNYVQEVVKKFDAGQSLIVTAYDQSSMVFGHGSLLAVDNRIDTETQTLKCKARLIPEGGNLMVPGMFLTIRMLLEVKHGVIRVPLEAIEQAPASTFVWVDQGRPNSNRPHCAGRGERRVGARKDRAAS